METSKIDFNNIKNKPSVGLRGREADLNKAVSYNDSEKLPVSERKEIGDDFYYVRNMKNWSKIYFGKRKTD
jgi:hypothetical protein